MGANPNIFINKENRRVVPPEEENFFVSAEEFKEIDTAFASKADQSSLDSLSGSVSGLSSLVSSIDGEVTTLQTDLATAETDITNLQSSKEDTANKTDSFATINTTLYPNWKGVQDYVNEEVPQQDPDNFATASNVTYIQNEYGRRVSSSVSFDRSAIYASEFDTDTKRVIAPVYTDLAITKTGAFHKNKADVFHSSETVPTVISSPASWLIVTGDSYLTGFENLNYMEMEYFERIKISSTYYEDVVVCNITAIVNGNSGDALNADLMLYLKYDDVKDLSLDPNLLNSSELWADTLDAYVAANPTDAAFVDLGGGNYALNTGVNGTASLRSRHECSVSPEAVTAFNDGTGITVIVNVKRAFSGTAMSFFSNQADSETDGVRFSVNTADNVTVRINGINTTANATGLDTTNSFWYAFTFDGTTTKIFRKSTGAGLAFAELLSNTVHSGQVLNIAGTSNVIWFERNNSGSTTPQGVTSYERRMYRRALTSAQIEAIMVD